MSNLKQRACTCLTYIGAGIGVLISPVVIAGLICINSVYVTSFLNSAYLLSYYFAKEGSLDVFLACIARPVLECILVCTNPYPSWFRCLFSFAITVVMACLGWRWCLRDSCIEADRSMLIGTLVCSCIYTLSQFWIPTSKRRYAESEKAVLEYSNVQNYTIVNNKDIAHIEIPGTGPPLVIVHGFGQTKVCWMETFAELRKHFHIYSIDCPGNGGSNRKPYIFKSNTDAELLFCEKFEAWRREMGLTNFILLGHSMGGYLSGVYALRHPNHIVKLVMFSPVGMPIAPAQVIKNHYPLRWRLLFRLWGLITPQQVLRWLGPVGEWATGRGYFERRFPEKPEEWKRILTVNEYHNAVGPASYEAFLFSILQPGAYSRCALSPRLNERLTLPTAFIYGEDDWMTPSCGKECSHVLRKKNMSSVFTEVPGVGHQIQWRNPEAASRAIIDSIHQLQATGGTGI